MTAGAWSTSDVARRCREMRDAVRRRHAASEEEVESYWPGGANNQEANRKGRWIFCYANLVRMMGRTETRDADPAVDRAIAAALAHEPIGVACADGVTRAVHPKSYHALRWLDALDRSLLDIAPMIAALDDSVEATKVLSLAPLAESLAVRLWAWIITTGGAEGAATLPFDEEQSPEPPDWTKALTPGDILALARAHAEVNARRLRIISEAFPAEASGGSRLTLSGFLGTAAQELGARPADVLRRWSLGEVFAQAVTAAEAAREARARAERKTGS